jgi:hypothetical protein
VAPTPELIVEPNLTFTPQAWRMLILYVTLCPFEIGGLGSVEMVGDDFHVTDIHIVHQDVNDIATRLDADSVTELVAGIVERGDDPAQLRLWWHSHARESTFWSGEDEETIAGFRNDGMVSLVINHAERILARFDQYEPRSTRWVWVDRPAALEPVADDERDAIRSRIADAVRFVPAPLRERVY